MAMRKVGKHHGARAKLRKKGKLHVISDLGSSKGNLNKAGSRKMYKHSK